MTFLPIVHRELQVASRRRLTFWARLMAATVAVGVTAFILATEQRLRGVSPGLGLTAATGATLFFVLTVTAFGGCLFAGVLLTADCVSSERREETLGLLFLTDLNGYDVALGKLAGRSLVALYCLLAIVPVAALPLLWGGVTVSEFARVAAVLVNTLLLSLALGLFVSGFCRERHTALTLAEAALLLLVVLGPLLADVLGTTASRGPLFVFLLASPIQLFHWAFARGPASTPSWFVSGFCLQAALTVVLLALASWRLPHCWQARPTHPAIALPKKLWQWWKFGRPAKRLRLRRRLLELNPLCWLGSRDHVFRHCLWSLAAVVVGFALIMNMSNSPWQDPSLSIGPMFFVHGVIKFIVAADAAGRFEQLRRNDLLSLVWSSRLSVAEIVQGQTLAMRRLHRSTIGAALAYDVLWLVMSLRDSPVVEHPRVLLLFGCVVPMFLWDLHAVSQVALWQGLRLRRPNLAAYVAMWQVLVLPWFAVGLCVLVLNQPKLLSMTIVWTVASALVNIILGRTAARSLREQFHQQVQDRVVRSPKTAD